MNPCNELENTPFSPLRFLLFNFGAIALDCAKIS